MSNLESIADAIDQIAVKKSDLRLAFDDLRRQSSSLATFPLTWSHIDSHFSSIHSSLNSRLSSLLQNPNPNPNLNSPPIPQTLAEICRSMDGIRLRDWLKGCDLTRTEIEKVIGEALGSAPDPGRLVLDAIEGLPGPGTESRGCFLLIEGLMGLGGVVGVSEEVRERARETAREWKGRLKKGEMEGKDVLLVLEMMAVFGLGDECGKEDLVELVMFVFQELRGLNLLGFAGTACRMLGLEDELPEVVKKIASMGKIHQAFKLIFLLNLSDKCPPVSILKSCEDDAKTHAREARKKAKMMLVSGAANNNEFSRLMAGAANKELGVLERVQALIKEHNLGAEYPIDVLEKRIDALKSRKGRNRQDGAAKTRVLNQPKQRQHSARRGDILSSGPAPMSVPVVSPSLPQFQYSHIQVPTSAVLSSSAGAYGYTYSAPTPGHYLDPQTGQFHMYEASLGYIGNPSYPSSIAAPNGASSGPYGQPPQAGHAALPQHNLSYHPQ